MPPAGFNVLPCLQFAPLPVGHFSHFSAPIGVTDFIASTASRHPAQQPANQQINRPTDQAINQSPNQRIGRPINQASRKLRREAIFRHALNQAARQCANKWAAWKIGRPIDRGRGERRGGRFICRSREAANRSRRKSRHRATGQRRNLCIRERGAARPRSQSPTGPTRRRMRQRINRRADESTRRPRRRWRGKQRIEQLTYQRSARVRINERIDRRTDLAQGADQSLNIPANMPTK